MKKLLSASLLAFVAFAPTLSAQISVPVSLTGRIEAAPAGACDPDATHRVSCSDVLLKSSTLDLGLFAGRTVDLTGSLDPLTGCMSIEVDSIAQATAFTSQLAIFGTRLGRTVAFTTFTPPGSVVVYLFGCQSGFLPLGQFGTYLMGIQDTVFLGAVLSIGLDLRTETIPNDPALVGVQIWSQFAFASVTNGIEVRLLNANCFTIQQ